MTTTTATTTPPITIAAKIAASEWGSTKTWCRVKKTDKGLKAKGGGLEKQVEWLKHGPPLLRLSSANFQEL